MNICQDVCPHNKNIPITEIKRFKEDTIIKLDIEEINDISNKEFKRRYGNRAFSWRGKNTIKRNIDIVSKKPNEVRSQRLLFCYKEFKWKDIICSE